MNDQGKSREQLIEELARLRGEVATLRQETADRQSDCQRMEAALQESDRRFKALLYNLPEKVFHKDRESVYVSCNRNYAEDFGLEPEQMIGKTDYDLFPRDIAAKYRADDGRIMAAGGTAEIEESYYAPTEEERTIRTVKAALRDDDGEVTGILGIFSDITERKRTEEALQRSEAKYRRLHDSMRDAFISVTMDGRIQEHNEAFRELLGYRPEELAALTFRDLTPSKWHAFQDEIIERQVLVRGYSDIYQKEYRRKDGTVVPVELRTELLRDDKGHPCGMWAIIRDITGRKQNEEALQRAHDELNQKVKERTAELAIFHRFAEASGRGFGMADLDGRITYVNPTLCRLFGEEKPEDVIGRHVTEYYPEEYRQKRENEIVPAALRGGSWQGEQVVIPRRGTPTPTFQNTFLIRDENGAPFRLGVAVSDVSELKRAEETVRRSEERLQLAVSATNDAIWDCNLLDGTVHCNENYAASFGRPPEGGGSRQWWLDRIHPDDRDRTASSFRQALRGSERFWTAEYRFLRADGRWADVFDRAYIGHDESGKAWRVVGAMLDITERKQTQEALRESCDQLETIYGEMVEGLFIAEIGTKRFMRVNASLCRMLGYSEEELVAASIEEIQPARGTSEDLYGFQAAAEGRGSLSEERPVLRKDGSVFYADITARRIFYGERPCLLALLRDVTERKQAAEALRQSRDELQAIYDGMNDGLLIADAETEHFVRANSSICRMLGYSAGELLAMSVGDIHPAEALPTVRGEFQALAKNRARVAESVPMLRKNGTVFHADISNGRIVYNRRRCVVGFFRDISDRRRAEETLRRSEERFRSYFEQALMGMAVTRIDKRWREVNDRLCDILGYSREELLMMKWTDATHPDDLEDGLLQFNRMVAGEIDHYTQDKRFIRKNGDAVYATVFVRCFRCKDGTIDHILALIEDTTERKRAEEALERQHRTLKHLLQSSDHERQLIAYEIHDGLAQQLAGAIMQLDAFTHLKDEKPQKAKKVFDLGMTMLRQSHFDARRLISGVRPPILDEAGVVAAVAHLVNEERRKKGPKIEYLSKVGFDRLTPILENAVYRIIQEGLSNACRHSKSKVVHVRLMQEGDRIRIEIQDQGIGFRLEDIEESHFGVAGMRERARLLGGIAVIDSEPGKGTRILVELPTMPSKD